MAEGTDQPQSVLKRRTTRRVVLGGTVAAASLAAAYAAFGNQLSDSILSSSKTDAEAKALEKESVRVSHLLRRTGFGVTKAEYDRYQSMGLDATITELVNFTSVDDSEAVRLANEVPLEANNRNSPPIWWLIRIANTRRPLQEKMTLFWHNVLTSQISVVRDPIAMVNQNEFLRSHAMDSFPTILRGISADRAMMVYLDVDGSQASSPNENYARELMELFALGIGNYTEEDVREASRAFTGWEVPLTRGPNNTRTYGDPVFRPQRFDNGVKTFLGRTGNFRPDDIIDIIVAQPASAEYITRRLFDFFVFPDPSDKDIAPFVGVYNQNDRRTGAVVEAMLRSDVFYSPRAYRSQVKSPIEYTVGAIKALGAQGSVSQLLAAGQGPRGGGLLGEMGQILFEPPNVAGWPGGAAWLNTGTIFGRLNFLNQVTGGGEPQRGDARTRQPQTFNFDLGTASQALAHFLPLSLDDNLPEESRQVLLEYAGDPEATLSPEQLRGLVYLVFGSPQFHLA
jgi:uncharacterized protein (DUF1800 family)